MTSADHDRAKELIAEAAELDQAQLEALAAQVRDSEPAAVRAEFEQWLADYQAAEAAGFLAEPATSDTTNSHDNQATIDHVAPAADEESEGR